MARIKFNERFRVFRAKPSGNNLSFTPATLVENKDGDIIIANKTGLKIRVGEGTVADILADIIMDGTNNKAQVRMGTAVIQKGKAGKLIANVSGDFKMHPSAKYQLRFPEESMMETPTLKHVIKSW